jgi:LysM repeat protein
VALAEDRDRRADAPDDGNRCYAERAPRRRDLSHQADYCYSPGFAACPAFLAWAARNVAEPAYVTEAAQRAWGSGIAGLEDAAAAAYPGTSPESYPGTTPESHPGTAPGSYPGTSPGTLTDTQAEAGAPAASSPEGGLFGLADHADSQLARSSEQLDWVSASAWAEAPWDERAEIEAEETENLDDEEPEEDIDDTPEVQPAEATQAPKVPAALPMRRRKRALSPIRSRGSGEWFYADPPGRDPLVKRRYGVTPPILLAVLGLLVVSVVVFVLATQLGDGGDGEAASAASIAPASSLVPTATRPPAATEEPSAEPSEDPKAAIRPYTVKEGDVLSAIAARKRVDVKLLQCMNRLLDPDVLRPGQVLQIPPDGYVCPPGWRRSTPEPLPEP